MSDLKLHQTEPEMKGWLYKWTNYIKGYQKRWFVLSNGLLSYYRTQAEMAHTCRGTISLHGAVIHTEDSCNFVISNGGTQTFHLKASTEVERQRWVTALELAKAKAIRMMESEDEEEFEDLPMQSDKNEMQTFVKTLSAKLEDLNTCNDLIMKHGAALQRSLSELEQLESPSVELATKIKAVNERATLFRITSNAMMNACSDYLELTQTQGRKWQRMLQHEHEQRLRLEEMVEQLARQHSHLEQAAKEATSGHNMSGTNKTYSDGEEEFFDAEDQVADYIVTIPSMSHRRTASGISTSSEGAGMNDGVSSSGSDGECEGRDTGIFSKKNHKPPAEGYSDKESSILMNKACGPMSEQKGEIKRRKSIPAKPNYSINLWSIMKNCIGKDLTKIPMPVNFSEPLSMLQRLTEDFEYSEILDKAAECEDNFEQMAYVAAFTVSPYATTSTRTGKPFNPLLGETYECDRRGDMGWYSISEQYHREEQLHKFDISGILMLLIIAWFVLRPQFMNGTVIGTRKMVWDQWVFLLRDNVSHHPPMAAQHCIGRGWACWQEFTMSSKFRGKYLQVIPLGISHLLFEKSGNHYTWRKITTTVHNIIVGKLWVDQHGEMDIINHKTGDKCHLKYFPYSYFSREVPRKVTGVVADPESNIHWVLTGTWDNKLEAAKVIKSFQDEGKGKPHLETSNPKVLWKRRWPPPEYEKMYSFTELAIELNEPEDDVAPTDCRNRPDQRLMENAQWDEANKEKVRLEEKQRLARRRREQEAERAAAEGRPYPGYEPVWFKKQKDPITGNPIHMYQGRYWECKEKQNWSACPDIF